MNAKHQGVRPVDLIKTFQSASPEHSLEWHVSAFLCLLIHTHFSNEVLSFFILHGTTPPIPPLPYLVSYTSSHL